MGKLRHIEQVAGDAAHNLAHLRIIIIGKRQLLQMGKQVTAHVGLNPGTHHMPHIRDKIVGRAVNNAQQQVESPHLQDNGHG